MFGRGFGFGGGMFLYAIIGIAVLLIIIAVIAKARRGRNPSLILEEFIYNETEDEFLKIKGRAAGFWNWILSLFGKAPMTNLTFNKEILKYEDLGINYNIPLINVTCISYGMLKSSMLLLVIGIIFILGGITFPIGIVLIIVWALNRKTLNFGIYVNENSPMVSIIMKRGIINSLDLNKFESSAKFLTDIVLKK